MWGTMRDWLKTASIPADRFLKSDLIGPKVKTDSKGNKSGNYRPPLLTNYRPLVYDPTALGSMLR
jgi:hypothetical protein